MLLIINPETLSLKNIFSCKSRVNIIEALARNGELNISKIIKLTKLNHATVILHLKFLKSINLVQEKDFGRIRIFRFKEEENVANYIKKLIKLIEDK